MLEIQRLEALLPTDLRTQVAIIPSDDDGRSLVITKRVTPDQFSIQIDFHQWLLLAQHQRNLLFWHEVARIQGGAVPRSSWEMIVISLGLGAGLIEFPSHSIIALAVALTVSGLASYRLYQRKRGEQSLREATASDQSAIALAMRFGYSYPEAYGSLSEALQVLLKQPMQKAHWRKYRVRLQVLEMQHVKGHSLDRSGDVRSIDQAEFRVQIRKATA
ncbi:MAG: hypothetical protein B0A82_11145 [Alkalinema sp. CACIAM 70d]|nr:MAG: hypothetical protein B0A82_11145 [Alkalinema sp. CACIAM 70d]